MNKSHKIILSVSLSIIAAILVVCIVLASIRNAPTQLSSSGNLDFVSSATQTVSPPEQSSEVLPVSSEEPVSSEDNVSSQESAPPAPLETVPTTPLQTQPLSSVHAIPEGAESFNITLSFLGDMILASDVAVANAAGRFNDYFNRLGSDYFLQNVRHIFEADDFTIANVENVFTDRQLTPKVKDYTPAFWFSSSTNHIDILSRSSVEGAFLANNHTYDYGNEGYNDTVATVRNAGMIHGDENNTMYFEKGGYIIAVVSSGLWGEYQANSIINALHEAQQYSHYQVVLFHGGTEAVHTPEEWKKRSARRFVDNGADLVVGGHPHVLQPREIYNGVEIIYSVGNFCYGGALRPENRTVIYQMNLTVGADLSLISSASNMIPCYVYTGAVNNYQPAIVDDPAINQRILDFMDGKISSPV